MSEFVPVLSARVGKKNSRALDTYVADGGYASWKKVLAGSKTGAPQGVHARRLQTA